MNTESNLFNAPIYRRLLTLCLLVMMSGFAHFAHAQLLSQATPLEQSVIHITTYRQAPMYDTPWRFDNVRTATGTGFVIEGTTGKRIMTNAHVVSWAKEIYVRRFQDPKQYRATVEFAGHDCDLALLKVEDERFFEPLPPLPFGQLPKVRSTVTTYGYPAGGQQISYTQGVVSRIEMQGYAHIGNRSFLVAQTDAAINPGNSGGPVIQGGKVVGVAFQGQRRLENTGFFIPWPIVRHFLDDVKDGTYHGFPTLRAVISPLKNKAYRGFLKLDDGSNGALVSALLPGGEGEHRLKLDDVILSVRGQDVGRDGTILYEGNRVHCGVLFDDVQHGESVPVTVWRDGKQQDIEVVMHIYKEDQNQGAQYDRLPRYFIHAGLVFVPLSRDYMIKAGRKGGSYDDLLYFLRYAQAEKPNDYRPEPVVLSQVLPHAVNADMQLRTNLLVDAINGVKIERLEDVPKGLKAAKGDYHNIQFISHKALEVIKRKGLEAAHDELLKQYRIQEAARW